MIIYWRLKQPSDDLMNISNNINLPTTQSEYEVKNCYISENSNPAASQQNMKKLLSHQIFHLSPVPLTPVINLYFRISPRIFIKIRYGPHGITHGPRRKWCMKKTWSQKSGVRLPSNRHFLYCIFTDGLLESSPLNESLKNIGDCVGRHVFVPLTWL